MIYKLQVIHNASYKQGNINVVSERSLNEGCHIAIICLHIQKNE